ncbi:MAG: hypothetical protein ACP5VR_13120, partial [Acidimicrobiales bacterium]
MRRWPVLFATLAVGALFLANAPDGVAQVPRALASWPYTATVTSGPRSGQKVGLALLDNITMEDIGAQTVGSAVLDVAVASSPYRCLNGQSISVFSYDGQLFLHNGLQGPQCTYGTWEVVPPSVTSPSQLPVATGAHISTLPISGPVGTRSGNVVVSGRGFGHIAGSVLLIGQSTVSSGPVVQTTVRAWAPGTVVVAPREALSPEVPYDVLLVTSAGTAATTVLRVPRALASWPYTATVTSGPRSGQKVGL